MFYIPIYHIVMWIDYILKSKNYINNNNNNNINKKKYEYDNKM